MNTGLVIVWLALAVELPPWLLGVWTRDWMEWKGVRTSVLDVHYLQTPTIFGDVRIPIDRPKFPRATSFADLTDSELRSLTRQLGYAGRTTVTGDTSTWHEEIEFQPDDGSPDMGRLERVNDSTMYEHALDSSYVESWRSVSRGEGRFLVVCVERDARLERTLIVVGNQFLYVRNRAKDLPVAESLDSLIITTRATRAQIIAYLDCEFSTGRVRGRAVPWQIRAFDAAVAGRPASRLRRWDRRFRRRR